MTRVVATSLLLGFTLLSCMNAAFAQGVTPVRPVPGLACMMLDPRALEATRQEDAPPVLAEPNPNSIRLGYPTMIVFVKAPLREVNGYIAMVRLNGQSGWIAANHLQPWHSLNGATARCTPMLMSNGLLGTSIR